LSKKRKKKDREERRDKRRETSVKERSDELKRSLVLRTN